MHRRFINARQATEHSNKDHSYPEVKMTDNERSATSLNTTDGFKHHKPNEHVQLPKAFSACKTISVTFLF